jgi:hypothetical protein
MFSSSYYRGIFEGLEGSLLGTRCTANDCEHLSRPLSCGASYISEFDVKTRALRALRFDP